MPRKVEVEVEQPFGWSGKPIFFDDSTNEYLMRRESIPDMIKMAKQPDPAGRILLHEELQRAQPNEDVIDALLNLDPERIKKKNEFGSSAMHVLCQNIHSVESDIILILLEAWPECVRQKNNFGFLPLHKCMTAPVIFSNPPRIDNVEMIIEAFPEATKLQSKTGETALHVALSQRRLNLDVLEMLMEQGPQACKAQDKYGNSPLHKACSKNGRAAVPIVETLMEIAPEMARAECLSGMLPLHWAIARDDPCLEVLIELIEVHPYAVFHRDKKQRTPMDLLLERGRLRCGSTMEFMNTSYQKITDTGKQALLMWDEIILKNEDLTVKMLKAPGQAPRPTPYTFGEVDWCLTDLTHTERQMALIYYGRMVRRKLMCSDEEMKDFYLGLRREFCKRKGDFSCFGDKLPGAQRGSLSKWWLADVSLPDWEHTFVGGVKKKLKGSVMAIMMSQQNEAKQQERAKGMRDKLLQKAASVKEISLSPSQSPSPPKLLKKGGTMNNIALSPAREKVLKEPDFTPPKLEKAGTLKEISLSPMGCKLQKGGSMKDLSPVREKVTSYNEHSYSP